MEYPGMNMKQSIPFDLQRKVVSHMTTSSWQSIPHVSYIYEPDITDFYNEYTKLAKDRKRTGCRLTLNTIMIKVFTEGLLQAPILNSYIEYNDSKGIGTLHILDEIHISIPWLLTDGRMITPSLLHVEKKSLKDIADEMVQLSKRIENTNIDEMLYEAVYSDTVAELRKGNLRVLKRIYSSRFGSQRVTCLHGKEKEVYYRIPEADRLTGKDIRSGTVTFSNIGSLYKEQVGFLGLLEIIPPQVFAIGIGSIQDKPGVYASKYGTKEIGIRKFLPICLAFDHRAFDFNSLVPFLKRLDEIFAEPKIIQKW